MAWPFNIGIRKLTLVSIFQLNYLCRLKKQSMDFSRSELTEQVAQTAKDFALQFIKPHLMEWDESQEFPVHIFKEMGKLGLMGVLVPEEYGGAGLSYFEYKTVIQEISKVCGSIGLSVAAHNSLCTGHIMKFGNEA